MPFDESLSHATNAVARLSTIGSGPAQNNVDTALRDLSLPGDLTTRLGRLFEDLGYPLTTTELRERYGDGRRTFTLAQRSEADVRHLVHIPREILDDVKGQMPVATLAFAFPEGARAFVLSAEQDGLNQDYWEKIQAGWERNDVAARFVGWRDVTRDLESKAREEQLTSIAKIFNLDANGTPPAPAESTPVADAPSERPRVFISYSWDSPEHQQRVLQLAEWLVANGADVSIDKWVTSPPQRWPQWCADEIERARFVLVVCTETYRNRAEHRQPPPDPGAEPVGLGATWESSIITIELYESTGNEGKFIPVVFSGDDLQHILLPLRGASRYRLYIRDEWKSLYGAITEQREHVPPQLGPIVKLDEVKPPQGIGQGEPRPGA